MALEAWLAAWLTYRANCLAPKKATWIVKHIAPHCEASSQACAQTKVRVRKTSPLILKVLQVANPFLMMPTGQPTFQVLHAFRGSFTYGATRSARHLALSLELSSF